MGMRCFLKQRQVHKGREWDVHHFVWGVWKQLGGQDLYTEACRKQFEVRNPS